MKEEKSNKQQNDQIMKVFQKIIVYLAEKQGGTIYEILLSDIYETNSKSSSSSKSSHQPTQSIPSPLGAGGIGIASDRIQQQAHNRGIPTKSTRLNEQQFQQLQQQQIQLIQQQQLNLWDLNKVFPPTGGKGRTMTGSKDGSEGENRYTKVSFTVAILSEIVFIDSTILELYSGELLFISMLFQDHPVSIIYESAKILLKNTIFKLIISNVKEATPEGRAYKQLEKIINNYKTGERLWENVDFVLPSHYLRVINDNKERMKQIIKLSLQSLSFIPNLSSVIAKSALHLAEYSSNLHFIRRSIQIFQYLKDIRFEMEIVHQLIRILVKFIESSEYSNGEFNIPIYEIKQCLFLIINKSSRSTLLPLSKIFWIAVTFIRSENCFIYQSGIEIIECIFHKLQINEYLHKKLIQQQNHQPQRPARPSNIHNSHPKKPESSHTVPTKPNTPSNRPSNMKAAGGNVSTCYISTNTMNSVFQQPLSRQSIYLSSPPATTHSHSPPSQEGGEKEKEITIEEIIKSLEDTFPREWHTQAQIEQSKSKSTSELYVGLNLYLLKGICSEQNEYISRTLLNKFILLPDSFIFDENKERKVIVIIISMLPYLLTSLGKDDSTDIAFKLKIIAQQLNNSQKLVHILSEYSIYLSSVEGIRRFLYEIAEFFVSTFFPSYQILTFSICIWLLEKGPARYKTVVLQIIEALVVKLKLSNANAPFSSTNLAVLSPIFNHLNSIYWEQCLRVISSLIFSANTSSSAPSPTIHSIHQIEQIVLRTNVLDSQSLTSNWKPEDNMSKSQLIEHLRHVLGDLSAPSSSLEPSANRNDKRKSPTNTSFAIPKPVNTLAAVLPSTASNIKLNSTINNLPSSSSNKESSHLPKPLTVTVPPPSNQSTTVSPTQLKLQNFQAAIIGAGQSHHKSVNLKKSGTQGSGVNLRATSPSLPTSSAPVSAPHTAANPPPNAVWNSSQNPSGSGIARPLVSPRGPSSPMGSRRSVVPPPQVSVPARPHPPPQRAPPGQKSPQPPQVPKRNL